MTSIVTDYILTFLHPFKTHEFLRESRENLKDKFKDTPLVIASEDQVIDESTSDVSGLNFVEVLSISWIMAIVNGVYSIGFIYFGYMTSDVLSESESLSFLISSTFQFETQKILISWSILQVVLFPVTLWFYAKVWMVIIKFFGNLFEFDGDVEEVTVQIVNHSMVTSLFLIVPIFGEMVRHFSSIVYLFAGLRKNMELSTLQSLIVVASPLFIFVLLIILGAVYISSLIAML
ncbi:hypothetical protein A9Q84_03500 [Halobacteriovorax marinus]|uniref:Yip1 domain-containing protein n=1 Tax=Halobacteriovorax marinus TaxID=97084 RepID=A0A1Y5FAF9_9BACT|nr:hypothetical protein A9Q84_03500 [Halobacteriovorax marinus]